MVLRGGGYDSLLCYRTRAAPPDERDELLSDALFKVIGSLHNMRQLFVVFPESLGQPPTITEYGSAARTFDSPLLTSHLQKARSPWLAAAPASPTSSLSTCPACVPVACSPSRKGART